MNRTLATLLALTLAATAALSWAHYNEGKAAKDWCSHVGECRGVAYQGGEWHGLLEIDSTTLVCNTDFCVEKGE